MARVRTEVTINLGTEKRRKLLEKFAREKEMSLQDMVLVALRQWLEGQEEEEDLRAIEEVEHEPTRLIKELLAEIGESDLLNSNDQAG
jgi:hypothetical protein